MNIKTNLSLERKISTGQYENITIKMEMDSDISADHIDEFNSKFDFFRSQFLNKFSDTQIKVIEELSIQEKVAFFNSPNSSNKTFKLNEMDLKEVLGD
jgi:hypothetical protein